MVYQHGVMVHSAEHTNRLKVVVAFVATLAMVIGFSGAAFAAHSHVINPSGCHETNFNATKAQGDSQWRKSAGGHNQSAESSPVQYDEGCPAL